MHELTTFATLIATATRRLEASGSPSPRLDAEVLLRHAAGLDRTGLLVAIRERAGAGVEQRFYNLVERRASGIPVAYLTGVKEFMGLPLAMDECVLVPRPETELLVEWALTKLPDLDHRPVRAVDVGSGSGAIAIAMAVLASVSIDITAVEPLAGAREIVARNHAALLPNNPQMRFRIVNDDLLTHTSGPFDLVLANLPYLTPAQMAENPELAAEPRLALDGGIAGLDLIERLIAQLPDRLAARFAVGLEIDPSQAQRVVELVKEALPGADITVIQDYAGLDRHVVATRF